MAAGPSAIAVFVRRIVLGFFVIPVGSRQGRPSVRIVADQLRRPVPGGIGTYVSGLAQGLRDLGVPGVSLWASRPPREDRLPSFGFPVINSVFPSRVLSRMWDHGIGGDTPTGVDLIHATSFAMPPTALPLTVTIHDTAWRAHPEAYPDRGRTWHERGLQRALGTAAAIFTPSPLTASDVVAEGFPAGRVFTIEEGVDHLAAPDDDGANELLFDVGVAGPFFLAVGTLEPRKNLSVLMEAYDSIRKSLPDFWPLLVVGPIGWGDVVTPIPGVVLAGKVSDGVLSSLYSKCHVFASVPLSEGYGLPAVEAMSMGAPVVSSSVPSLGGAAYEVLPTDTEAIGRALLEVGTDEALRADLRLRGAQRSAKLTWRAVAQQHWDAWKQIVDSERERG